MNWKKRDNPLPPSVEDLSYFRSSALYYAAKNYRYKIFEKIRNGHADSEILDGIRSLHEAAASEIENPELIRAHLASGINLNASDRFGMPPLHRAVEMGRVTNTEALLTCGANINALDSRRRTPLHIAADHQDSSHLEVVRVLLRDGHANPNALDAKGRTPLTVAKICVSLEDNVGAAWRRYPYDGIYNKLKEYAQVADALDT